MFLGLVFETGLELGLGYGFRRVEKGGFVPKRGVMDAFFGEGLLWGVANPVISFLTTIWCFILCSFLTIFSS